MTHQPHCVCWVLCHFKRLITGWRLQVTQQGNYWAAAVCISHSRLLREQQQQQSGAARSVRTGQATRQYSPALCWRLAQQQVLYCRCCTARPVQQRSHHLQPCSSRVRQAVGWCPSLSKTHLPLGLWQRPHQSLLDQQLIQRNTPAQGVDRQLTSRLRRPQAKLSDAGNGCGLCPIAQDQTRTRSPCLPPRQPVPPSSHPRPLCLPHSEAVRPTDLSPPAACQVLPQLHCYRALVGQAAVVAGSIHNNIGREAAAAAAWVG